MNLNTEGITKTRLKPLGRLARENNFNAMEELHRAITEAITMREHIYKILAGDPDKATRDQCLAALTHNDRVIQAAEDTRAYLIHNAEIFQQAAKRGAYHKDGH